MAWVTLMTVIIGSTVLAVAVAAILFYWCAGEKFLRQISVADGAAVHCECDPNPQPGCSP